MKFQWWYALSLSILSLLFSGCSKPPSDLDEDDPGGCRAYVSGSAYTHSENNMTIPLLQLTKKKHSVEIAVSAIPFKNDFSHRGKTRFHFDDEPFTDIDYRIFYTKVMNLGYVDNSIVLLGDDAFLQKFNTAKSFTIELTAKEGMQEVTFGLQENINDSCIFNPEKKTDKTYDTPVGQFEIDIK